MDQVTGFLEDCSNLIIWFSFHFKFARIGIGNFLQVPTRFVSIVGQRRNN